MQNVQLHIHVHYRQNTFNKISSIYTPNKLISYVDVLGNQNTVYMVCVRNQQLMQKDVPSAAIFEINKANIGICVLNQCFCVLLYQSESYKH